MRVEGNINTILSGYHFYLKYLGRDIKKSEEDLRKEYLDGFIEEDLQLVENQIDELSKLEIQNSSSISSSDLLENQNGILEEGNSSEYSSVDFSEVEEVILENENFSSNDSNTKLEEEKINLEEQNSTYSAKDFLNSIINLSSNSADYVSHEVFIDEYVKQEVSEVIEDYSSQKESIVNTINELNKAKSSFKSDYNACEHGIFIDEYSKKSSKIDFNHKSYVEHGIFIDEYEIKKSETINSQQVEEIEDTWGETNDISEDVWNDVVEEINETSEDVWNDIVNEVDSIEEVTKESIQDIEIPVKESYTKQQSNPEVIVVPTNIRDFIKANQGVSMSYVLEYYSKKDVTKAINLGKIYAKGGKLYV